MPRHRRSFGYTELSAAGALKSQSLCFKGFEPLAADFVELLSYLDAEGPTKSGLSLLEHLLVVENKLPCANSLVDAEREAWASSRYQAAHFGASGIPARLPIAIAVVPLPDNAVAAYLDAVKVHLNRGVWSRLDGLAAAGLAGYVYLYRGPATRVINIKNREFAAGASGRLRWLLETTDPFETICNWIATLADMLHLGWLPVSPESTLTGACVDENNAVIDGGFADIGSLVPVSDFADGRAAAIHVGKSVQVLTQTILSFVAGGHPALSAAALPEQAVASWIRAVCRERLGDSDSPLLAALSDDGGVVMELLRDHFRPLLARV